MPVLVALVALVARARSHTLLSQPPQVLLDLPVAAQAVARHILEVVEVVQGLAAVRPVQDLVLQVQDLAADLRAQVRAQDQDLQAQEAAVDRARHTLAVQVQVQAVEVEAVLKHQLSQRVAQAPDTAATLLLAPTAPQPLLPTTTAHLTEVTCPAAPTLPVPALHTTQQLVHPPPQ